MGDIESVRLEAFERNFDNQIKLLDAYNESYPKWVLKRSYVPYEEDDPNTRTVKERYVYILLKYSYVLRRGILVNYGIHSPRLTHMILSY